MILNADDLLRISEIQRAMLRIPRERSIGGIRELLESIVNLINASGAWCGTWFDGELLFVPYKVGPQIEQQFRDNFIGIDEDGFYLMRDPEYEEVNRRRREGGSAIVPDWVLHEHAPMSAEPPRWFAEGILAAGVTNIIGMSARLPVGEALMVFAFDGEDDPAYRDPQTLQLLELLHPSMVAAFEQLYENSFDREAYLQFVGMLPFPAALRANDGDLIASSGAAQGRDWNAIRRMASDDNLFVLPGPNLPDLRKTEMLVDLSGLDINFVRQGRQQGLSERQAEVANLIVLGLSDKEIARKLEISPNTARRHSEAVLDRLRVNSRSGVLLALLTGRSPRLT